MRTAVIYSAVALLALCNHAYTARILGLFPHTGKSHQMVFDPLLRRLAERGHHVTVVSFFPTEDPPANYTDVSLEGIARLGVETIDLSMYEKKNKLVRLLGVESILKQIVEFSPLGDMALATCSRLVEWPALADALKKKYDLVLVENFNSDCMLGLLHVYGIKAPTVAMLSSSLMPWSAQRIGLDDNPSHVPSLSTKFTTRMNFMERLENTFIHYYFKTWFHNTVQVKEQEIIERHFGKRIPNLQDLAKNMSLLLVNTFHSLNGVRPKVPGVVEVGGMHLDPNKRPIPCHIERFLNDSEEGAVVFSFGSLIKTATLPKYKEEIIVNALSKLKQKVIWKYEDSGEEGNLTGNILRVKWIPQYELLQHKKVLAFIAHGGLLGMTEAIAAGKPMLVVPFFGDQPSNAAAAEAAGLAKVVSYADLTEHSLYEAMQKVLSAEMRLSARRASQIWRDRPADPLDTAVYWTERVIRWGHQAPLHSVARDMSFIQLALLDVAAACLAAIVVLILVLKVSASLILRLTNGVTKENKKKVL